MEWGCHSNFVTSCFKNHIDFHRVCSRLLALSLEGVDALRALNMSFHKPWRLLTSAQVGVDYGEKVCCMEYSYGWKTGERPAAVLEATGTYFHREAWISCFQFARYITIHRLQILSYRTRHFPKPLAWILLRQRVPSKSWYPCYIVLLRLYNSLCVHL